MSVKVLVSTPIQASNSEDYHLLSPSDWHFNERPVSEPANTCCRQHFETGYTRGLFQVRGTPLLTECVVRGVCSGNYCLIIDWPALRALST